MLCVLHWRTSELVLMFSSSSSRSMESTLRLNRGVGSTSISVSAMQTECPGRCGRNPIAFWPKLRYFWRRSECLERPALPIQTTSEFFATKWVCNDGKTIAEYLTIGIGVWAGAIGDFLRFGINVPKRPLVGPFCALQITGFEDTCSPPGAAFQRCGKYRRSIGAFAKTKSR